MRARRARLQVATRPEIAGRLRTTGARAVDVVSRVSRSMPRRASDAPAAGPDHVIVYSWQPMHAIRGETADGARHAGMSQRLMQVVRSACRLGLEVSFLSGQDEPAHAAWHRQSLVGSCRVSHYHGTTEQQYSRLLARGRPAPLFGFIFYTAAWFAVEQRAIRNTSGWALPEFYFDEEASGEGGLGRKERKLLQRLRSDYPASSIAVLTDDIQSDKLARVLAASRRDAGDAEKVAHVVDWMRARELSVYASADAVVTVSAHDAAWVRERLGVAAAARRPGGRAPLVMPVPFIAHPAPPGRVAPYAGRRGMLFIGVAHTSAAASMAWFARRVHPLLLGELRRRSNESEAQTQARLTVVGWGWKSLAREGPGCSAESTTPGRSSRCVGAAGGAGSWGEAADLVDLRHAVDDNVLAEVFASHRLFIAPCVSCTGVATKVVTALRHGLPVVCTSEATRGIVEAPTAASAAAAGQRADGATARARRQSPLTVEDDPARFAAAAASLLTAETAWSRRSAAALRHARQHLSEEVLDARMGALLAALAARRCAAGGEDAGARGACAYAKRHADAIPLAERER